MTSSLDASTEDSLDPFSYEYLQMGREMMT